MEFRSENPFEESLVKAATDPAHRPQFYKDLCGADLFIIQHGKEPPSKSERITLSERMTIQIENIEHEGKPYIPVFSSLPRLRSAISGEVAYLGVNALDLMKFTQGADLLLNPGSAYGKEFTREEIASILDGSIWAPSEKYVQKEAAQVMLGQPAIHPHELVAALSRFFKTRRSVKKAWLAHFHNPEDGHPPHTLVAVDAGNSYEAVFSEIGVVIAGVDIPDPPVDIIPITGNGGLEDYFVKGPKPFYVRKIFGIF